MNKSVTIILTFICLLFISTGCTQNGGHIGKIFGRWHLERIEAENMEAPQQRGDIYWAFQGNMFQMQRHNELHSYSTTYGTYRLEDNTLFLDFPQDDKPPFEQTGLGRENILQVLKLTHSEFVLLYNPTPDTSLTYYLRKW